MKQSSVRWLLLVVASAAVAFVALRRRQQILAALPEPIAEQIEHFVIPWPSSDPPPASTAETVAMTETVAVDEAREDEPEGEDDRRRKVSSNNRISYLGKRYGPLPQALVGQYVDVETRDNKLFILHNATPIATFDLSS